MDDAIAFGFDLKCGEYLVKHENEQEEERLAALTGAAITKQLGPILGKPEVRTTITQADIRDQGF